LAETTGPQNLVSPNLRRLGDRGKVNRGKTYLPQTEADVSLLKGLFESHIGAK
jgi:hypothetical protein